MQVPVEFHRVVGTDRRWFRAQTKYNRYESSESGCFSLGESLEAVEHD